MVSLRTCIHKLLLIAGVFALLTLSAAAADVPEIACQAKAAKGEIRLMEDTHSGSDCVATIPKGDTLVLLSSYEEGEWIAASYADGDESYTGYISADHLELLSVAEAAVLPDWAMLWDEASDNSEAVSVLSAGDEVSILGYEQGWFYVKVQDMLGYLTLEEVDCTMVTAKKVNLRSEPGTDADILDKLPKGTVLHPEWSEDEWVQVTYKGQTGFVSAEYLKAADSYTVEDPYHTSGEEVVEFAAQYLGNRYVWGGTSLEKGCDCSGYVMRVYEQFGVELPHSSRSIRNYGEEVSYSEMEAGDVVCYSGHVGIYAGNGQIINALNSRSGICYTDVNYDTIITIRRMV